LINHFESLEKFSNIYILVNLEKKLKKISAKIRILWIIFEINKQQLQKESLKKFKLKLEMLLKILMESLL
jgi:hypothetical protein